MAGQGCPRLGRLLAAGLAAAVAGAEGSPPSKAPQASIDGRTIAARATADLEAVCLVGREGWAVGDHGAILHTSDAGATWTPQESHVAERLLGVTFLDARRGWAVGGAFLPGLPASRGVVLRTEDGGRTWTHDRRQILPRLAGVHFVDEERGWVWGEPSGIYPSGLLSTSDGGRSFSPVDWATDDAPATGTAWLSGAAPQRGGLALLGRDGRVGLLRSGRLRRLVGVDDETTLFALAAADAATLVAAGDEGAIVRRALRAGEDEAPRAEPPCAIRAHWRGASATAGGVWLVGDPGTVVLRSDDAGGTWEAHPTGHTWPLTAVAFQGAEQGCAVGLGGTILRTSDGGRTWRPAREGATHADTLVIAWEPGAVPWECLDGAAASEIVVWCAGTRVAADSGGSAESRGARLRDALSACGARSAGMHGLPLWPAEARADGQKALAVWDNLAPEGAFEHLVERIVGLVDAWRPSVLCGPAADETTIAGLVGRATQEAWRITNAERDPATVATDPPPHRPRRWCVEVVDPRAPNSSVAAGATIARALAPGLPERSVVYQVRDGEGLGLTGDAALAVQRHTRSTSDDLARRVRTLQSVRAFAERRQPGGSDPSASIEAMLAELDDVSHAAVLAQLAARSTPDALPASRLLDERYPEHPLAAAAAWRRWRSISCAEQAQVERTPAARAERLQQAADASRGQIEQVGTSLRIDDAASTRETQALQLVQRLERVYPQLAFEPSARVSLAAWHRRQGRADEARRQLRAAQASRCDDAWSAWLRAESWLEAPRRDCPVALATCRLDAPRPTLDGRLDEGAWRSLAAIPLSSPWHDDGAFPAEAFLAADAEYLYLAVRCRRAAEIDYARPTPTRRRDADLEPFDRVSWRIDVDRDLGGGFELTIDQRGWAAERISTGAAWDPRWFIASQLDDEQWTAEAALPWTELGTTRPSTTEAWALRIERVAPGAGIQAWPPDEHPADAGPRAGLLRFAATGESAEPGRFRPQEARPIPPPDDGDVTLPDEVDRKDVP